MTPPPLDVVLARLARLPPAVAAEAARADQQARWAAGQRVRAELYLRALPGVASSAEDAALLVYGELLARTELGEAVDVDAFRGRFPRYAGLLAAVLEVHDGVEATPAPPVIPGYGRLEFVAAGGMGVVYKARATATSRLVAVKVVEAAAAAQPAALVRFLQEVEIVARLAHRNVVRYIGHGTTPAGPYLVTEWVPDGSLADRPPGPMTAAQAVGLARGAAAGLGAAHAAGVIHRDVKPGNVLLAGDVPKLADFGLARLADCGGTLSRTGDVIGTRRYMAPEQLDGDPRAAGPWSDVFALGAVLYELLAGRPALPARDTVDGLTGFTPPAPLVGVPPSLAAACATALRPDPRDRFPTAAAFAAALG